MAGFSYQQHSPFLLDAPYLPDTPIEMPFLTQHVGEMNNAPTGFPYYFSAESIPEASTTDTRTYESSCSLDSGVKLGGSESQMDDSSAAVEPKAPIPMIKRKKGQQSKGTKENKAKKQKKPSSGLKGREEKKSRDGEKEETKACEEPPTGYIHVRARRGQATDSHSLAERVRREKISLRMKVLQGLVPGCDKVVGKALMLDEIINYVQSLQNQVEFLSMKLASSNPMLYDFGVDFDDFMNPEKMGSIVQPMPSMHQTGHILSLAPEEATSSYHLVNTSAPHLLHGQGPTAYSQDTTSYLMQVDGNNKVGLNNICSFP